MKLGGEDSNGCCACYIMRNLECVLPCSDGFPARRIKDTGSVHFNSAVHFANENQGAEMHISSAVARAETKL
jgi:hypothetical protein